MTKIDPLTGEILDHKGRPLTSTGAEIPDPTPMQPPLGYKRQPPLHELIREMVRSEKLAQEAAAMGAETFEEAEDFGDDEDEPYSQYETELLDGFIEDNLRAGRIRADENGLPTFYPEKPLKAGADADPKPAEPTPKPSPEQGS